MEENITENGNRITKMAKDITGGQMEINIGESTRMTRNKERESNKRRENCTETNTKKTSARTGLKYSDVLDFQRLLFMFKILYVIYKHSKLYITLSR
jgi:hypothetical protein